MVPVCMQWNEFLEATTASFTLTRPREPYGEEEGMFARTCVCMCGGQKEEDLRGNVTI